MYHGLIHGRDAKHADQALDSSPGEFCPTSFLDLVENCSDPVSWNQASSLTGFNGTPKCRSGIGIGLAVQDHVQNHVEVEQKRFHRYFRAR